MDYLEIRELYHHGIKGQKWGIRRFQNEDGSLTTEGERRYYKANGKKKSKHRVNLEAHYMSKGLKLEEAEKKATNRMITEGALAAVGTALVTSAIVAAIVKHHKETADQVINAGTGDFQRVDYAKKSIFKKNMEKKNLYDVFYMTNNEFDNKNYEQAFTGPGDKLIKMKAAKDVKIASQSNAINAMREINKESPIPSSMYRSSFRSDQRGGPISKEYVDKFMKGEKVPPKIEKKIYENFNVNIVQAKDNPNWSKNYDRFYKNLKSKGYSGIQDINDLKISRLRAKNPLIIFDRSSVKITELADPKTSPAKARAARDAMDKLITKNYLDEIAPKAFGAAGATTLGAIGVSNIKTNINKGSKNFVANYLAEHPDTKLSTIQLKTIYKYNQK